jgi:hypothetical protein
VLSPERISEIVAQHDSYWDHRRGELRELRNLYLTRFWQDNAYPTLDGILRTEVPRAYAVVESYIGAPAGIPKSRKRPRTSFF